ncbi:MAG: hypothetical protein RI897_3542, partial [Verrucomicrobiota bacterium]
SALPALPSALCPQRFAQQTEERRVERGHAVDLTSSAGRRNLRSALPRPRNRNRDRYRYREPNFAADASQCAAKLLPPCNHMNKPIPTPSPAIHVRLCSCGYPSGPHSCSPSTTPSPSAFAKAMADRQPSALSPPRFPLCPLRYALCAQRSNTRLDPSKSSPTGSTRPPKCAPKNSSVTALNDNRFSGRANPCPSSGYNT